VTSKPAVAPPSQEATRSKKHLIVLPSFPCEEFLRVAGVGVHIRMPQGRSAHCPSLLRSCHDWLSTSRDGCPDVTVLGMLIDDAVRVDLA